MSQSQIIFWRSDNAQNRSLKFFFNAFLAHHCYDKRGREWNCGSDYSGFDEILQIGAVRIKALDGSILDTFNIYVRPRGNTALHPAAA